MAVANSQFWRLAGPAPTFGSAAAREGVEHAAQLANWEFVWGSIAQRVQCREYASHARQGMRSSPRAAVPHGPRAQPNVHCHASGDHLDRAASHRQAPRLSLAASRRVLVRLPLPPTCLLVPFHT